MKQLHSMIKRSQSFSPPNKVIKVSDLIAIYLAWLKLDLAFVLTGGCAVHLIDSLARRTNFKVLPMQHEQSAAMAADAYSRISKNKFGITISTSGPGATNLLTGVCCSFYDSVPVLHITGQVPSNQLKGNSNTRQIGFQETDVVSIYKSVTKYSQLIISAEQILYELDKAIFYAFEGRRGPVLLDICDDVQRAQINPFKLKRFDVLSEIESGKIKTTITPLHNSMKTSDLSNIFELINKAKRPLFVLGAGATESNYLKEIRETLKFFGIPYLVTWGAFDSFSHSDELNVGIFGVTSSRAGNFIIQNSDLIIAVGTRLDTHEIGNSITSFAPSALKVLIDIDSAELNKFDSRFFKLKLNIKSEYFFSTIKKNKFLYSRKSLKEWLKFINTIKAKYPKHDSSNKNQISKVNPYFLMEKISESIKRNHIVIPDCGSNLIWTMQGLTLNSLDQRVISAWNHSPMGYSIPAAIGASLADNGNPVLCIIGDGGLQINVQELATIQRNKLPNLKILVLNNHGHGIIQGTQDSWLNSRYIASSYSGGLPDPDYSLILKAYGLNVIKIENHTTLAKKVKKLIQDPSINAAVVEMKKGSQIYPKLLAGRPIHDMSPDLPKDEISSNFPFSPKNNFTS